MVRLQTNGRPRATLLAGVIAALLLLFLAGRELSVAAGAITTGREPEALWKQFPLGERSPTGEITARPSRQAALPRTTPSAAAAPPRADRAGSLRSIVGAPWELLLAISACMLGSLALVEAWRARRRARPVARKRSEDAAMVKQANELTRREQDLVCVAEGLRREEAALEERRRQVANDKQRLEEDLVSRRADLDRREKAVRARDQELAARRSEQELRQANLARLEAAIRRREEKLQREATEQVERMRALAEGIARTEARAAHRANEDEVRLAELERRELELRTGELLLVRARAVLERRNQRTRELLDAQAADLEAARRGRDEENARLEQRRRRAARAERRPTRREKTPASNGSRATALTSGRPSDRVNLVARADQLTRAAHAPDHAPLRHTPEPQRAATGPVAVGPSHRLFVPFREGYAFVERNGPAPGAGIELQLLDGADERASHFVVAKVGRSPLPSDARDCAYLQRVAPHVSRDAEPA